MSNTGDSSGTGVKPGPSSVKPPKSDGGPIIEESQESEEYQQDLQVVVGTTIGVIAVVGLVVVAVLLYRVYRARQRALMYMHQHSGLERNISLDMREKCQPMVLLLYANDCPMHQRVVEVLAGFLMEVIGVSVSVDVLEEAEIVDRGVDDWLVERLQEADYILVMCSLGARLRCSKKHLQFKTFGPQVLPDYFSMAVDYVAEKMRVEKQKGLSLDKFVVAYMEYSTQSDIPPQLETAFRFCLMRDMPKLHAHLKTAEHDSAKSDNGSNHSDGDACYHDTETGTLLLATIDQTKSFFKDNPSWMDQCLQLPSTRRMWTGKSRKRQHNASEQPLLFVNNSLPVQCLQEADSHQENLCPRFSYPTTSSGCVEENVAMLDSNKGHYSRKRSVGSHNSRTNIVVRGRHNSLPSSLARDRFIAPIRKDAFSNSMDNFGVKQSWKNNDHDGVLCLFCGNCHLDGVPECKRLATTSSCLPNDLDQDGDSADNLHDSLSQFSHSQTVLQAEVHQEWGTPVKTNYKKGDHGKSNTFGGGDAMMRSGWESNPDVAPPPLYQSLPPHLPPPHHPQDFSAPPPPSYPEDWGDTMGMLRKWDSHIEESPDLRGINVNNQMLRHYHHSGGQTLSRSSIFTNDSDSASDTDSLKRDLHSIQNISSFQEFVDSSLFVTSNKCKDRSPNPQLLPCVSLSYLLTPLSDFEHREDQQTETDVDRNSYPGQKESQIV